MIGFHCPGCDKTLAVEDNEAGTVTKCPGCGGRARVPVSRLVLVGAGRAGSRDGDPGYAAAPPRRRPAEWQDEGEGEPRGSRRRPARRRKERRRAAEASGALMMKVFLWVMLGLVVIGGLAGCLAAGASKPLLILGIVLAVLGTLWLIGAAVEEAELLYVLFVPGYSLIFMVRNFDRAGIAGVMQFAGGFLVGLALALRANGDEGNRPSAPAFAAGPAPALGPAEAPPAANPLPQVRVPRVERFQAPPPPNPAPLFNRPRLTLPFRRPLGLPGLRH